MKEQDYACEDCEHYSQHYCKLWDVTVDIPDDSHCESAKLT